MDPHMLEDMDPPMPINRVPTAAPTGTGAVAQPLPQTQPKSAPNIGPTTSVAIAPAPRQATVVAHQPTAVAPAIPVPTIAAPTTLPPTTTAAPAAQPAPSRVEPTGTTTASPPAPLAAATTAASVAAAAAQTIPAQANFASIAAGQPVLRQEKAALLEVHKLQMKFGGLTAVDNLSFLARHREITALIGPNGAGKTTVFNCITGFYRPTAGAIRLHTTTGLVELQRLADFEVTSKARVARTFQNIRLFSGMTVLENLMVAQHRRLERDAGHGLLGLVRGIFQGKRFRKAERGGIDRAVAWLDRIGLTGRADDPAGDLPYGDQRRLEIARAMLTEPVLLCLDEPAAGLNPRESFDLARLLRSIRDDDGVAILLIEHDMSVVMDISDHVVVLEYGRRIADGTPDTVKNDPNVIKAYLGVEHDALPDDAPVAPALAGASS